MATEQTRQIHLDFHTSELIPDIGASFSKKQFQEQLRRGHVNLINVFAKCHHGWSYYPTTVGIPHPNLKVDLLGQQVEACHEIGVKAPVYYTVGWSAHDAETHPEWCMRNPDGTIVAPGWDENAAPTDPKPRFQWKSLCPSGEYHELIVAQTEEILETYDVDGLWYDIYQPMNLCYCERCRRGMADAGLDPTVHADAEKYRALTILRHARDLRTLILSHAPEASVYFNGLTAIERPENFRHRLFQVNTKNDLEDLPTTWGGYDKFPVRSKFFLSLGKPVVAMSGKFHTAWGEFGGFKLPEAIRFEAASMISFGASCNFGDQLHPSGVMDPTTYDNIGHAYEYVEKIESLGVGGTPAASLGLWLTADLAADEGAARMLLEEQIDFDVVGEETDPAGFQTIVVPSTPGALKRSESLDAFLSGGGSLVFLGAGCLDKAATDPVIDIGATYQGPGRYDVDYTESMDASGMVGGGLPSTPFLNYEAAHRFAVTESQAEIRARVYEPYFSRTYGSYCGHQNTANRMEPAPHPAVWQVGRHLVFAHDLDRMYYAHGAFVHRALFSAELRRVHTAPMLEADLPSAGRVSLLHQPDKRRYVAHLLYGPPIQRGRCEVIEDLPTLTAVSVRLRLPEQIVSVRLEPEGLDLRFSAKPGESGSAGTIETAVPSFSCHCAVVCSY